ncbi:MAG: transcription termination/antitermination NusG family protein [Oscillospiraceae bacterium]
MKRWYVLHVLTGSEVDVQRQLKDEGVDAVVVQESVMLRRGGMWQAELRILFPGYVFAYIHYTPAAHYLLHGIPGVIRLLPKEKPMPLLPEDSAWLFEVCGEVLGVSSVDFTREPPVVVDGPLKELQQYIISYNRRQRRAQLRIPILGVDKEITLSIVPADTQIIPNASISGGG